MIEIKEVRSWLDAWRFTEFPNRMYKDVEAFVPALSLDERNVFSVKKNPVHEYCESIRFLAYKDKRIAGRIAGIINHKMNAHFGKKEVRFTRIDMIDDIDVTKALIGAVTDWGKSKGMDTMIGPIGFTDLDRQGMLVDGFDQLNMFITIYNHPYYKDHLETLGFVKDVDWVEKKITWPNSLPEKVKRGAEIARKRYGYTLIKPVSKKDVFNYVYDAFDVYNVAFQSLYGFFPITRKVMDYYIKQMILLVQLDYLWFVLDKNGKVVAITIIMPSLAEPCKKSNGKLLPFGWIRFLKAAKHHDVVDLYFIAVAPEHQNHGIIALMWEDAIPYGIERGIRYAESGPELEGNLAMQTQWKDFDFTDHKRRRCYTKAI
jgi:GNAT superfamily N-acetyltransferase